MSVEVKKMRFRRRAVPGFRGVKEPTAGDLRYPISLYRSERTPNANGSLNQTLTCYRNKLFAAFDQAPERMFEGENADATATHVFTIRWDGKLLVEVRDYVQWKDRFYKVSFTRPTGKVKDYLAIYTSEHFEAGNNDNLIIAPTTMVAPEDTSDQTNSGWSLPAA